MNNEVKIESITAENIKAVKSFFAVLGGNSAHVTGRNGYGKSTVIRVLVDKLRGLSPAIVTKIGETDGSYTMELTDGGRFVWEFNKDGKEKINYFTKNALTPVKKDVFKAIVNRYFPNEFDINKFLTTTEPRKRLNMLSELIKIDLSEIQERYQIAFKDRAEAKKELKRVQLQEIPVPTSYNFSNIANFCEAEEKTVAEIEKRLKEQKDLIEFERANINSIYKKNKAENDLKIQIADAEYQETLAKYDKLEKSRARWTQKFNDICKHRSDKLASIIKYLDELDHLRKKIVSEFVDFEYKNSSFESDLIDYYSKQEHPRPLKTFVSNPMPTKPVLNLADPMPDSCELTKLTTKAAEIETELESAKAVLKHKENEKNDLLASQKVYNLQHENYKKHLSEIEMLTKNVRAHEDNVENILNEIKAIVKSAKLPEEFSIDLTERNDILFKSLESNTYLPITPETLASSEIYIAAFKLHIFYVDLFKVVHFDVSYLDYINRMEVHKEAQKLGIQLITESAATNAAENELQYTIVDNINI